ncbi:ImmA/IrrE family metallo-endopeptidase [Solibacillus sp. FSL K6-1523]|uniref:ImmA/IrrE family metallo-endopeptidase n=1 Tax=Solibacillus sp. FSL K6-1523 TaxID=2921471 RepID=UPI0030FA7E71
MNYEQLEEEVYQHDIEIYERYMAPRIKGLYSDNIIQLNKRIKTLREKKCVLAEEFGHYHTSVGDILDQSNSINRKQELIARRWAYNKLVPLSKIVAAYDQYLTNSYELANYLDVTEEFLDDALKWYKSKYGLYILVDDYTLCFEPLGILEKFDWIETPVKQLGT